MNFDRIAAETASDILAEKGTSFDLRDALRNLSIEEICGVGELPRPYAERLTDALMRALASYEVLS